MQSHRALYAAFDAVPSRKGAGVHIEQFAGTLFRRFGGGLPVLRLAPELARTSHSMRPLDLPLLPGDSPGREGSIWLVMHAGPPAEIRELFRRAERSRLREDPGAALAPASPAPPAGLDRRVKVIDAHPATSLFSHCARIWTAAGFNPMDEPRPHRARHRFVPFRRPLDDQHGAARAAVGP